MIRCKGISMIRVYDIIFSVLAILILSPLFIIIMIILKFTGEGEIFYYQERVGSCGRRFRLLKFATMLKDSPNLGSGLVTVRGDERILPVGHILRTTKLNELPQLINVVRGDMSLIGPRPLVPEHLKMYNSQDRDLVLSVRPGLSGVGSIYFRSEDKLLATAENPKSFYENEIAPIKSDLEVWFVNNFSSKLYFVLIFLTLKCVLKPDSDCWNGKIFNFLPHKEKIW